jgi:hypothetical protein
MHEVGCEPCCVDAQGACGTDHPKHNDCLVVKEWKKDDHAQLMVGAFAADVLGRFVFCLLQLPDNSRCLPKTGMVKQYLDGASEANKVAIRQALPADLRDEVDALEVDAPGLGAPAGPSGANPPLAGSGSSRGADRRKNKNPTRG